MAGRIPMVKYQRCYEMLAAGADTGSISIELDVSTSWVERETAKWKRGELTVPKGTKVKRTSDSSGHRKTNTPQAIEREAGQFDFPKAEHELVPDAARALEDIDYFARRYYGIPLLPWQVMDAAKVVELQGTDEREFAVINVAPGAGKSTFHGRILPAWLTARNRALRGMIGSATSTISTQLISQLRQDMLRESPDLINDVDIKRGYIQAMSTLPRDFGRFRPDVSGALWTRNAFEVAQLDDRRLNQKEPSWSAWGYKTTFIGHRVDFALWDDLWDQTMFKTSDARDELFRWWGDTAEARIEPGGLLLLMGQRLNVGDIYRHALDMVVDLDDYEDMGDPDLVKHKYHHIRFPAIDESMLTGDKQLDKALLAKDAPPWPDGPLLDPKRLPWSELRTIKANDPNKFALVYQQSEEGVTERLVDPLWVSGGQNPDSGEYHPGCRDDDRRLWEVPQNLAGPLVSVAMTDPSGTNRWGHLWYLWQPQVAGETEDVRHLMALEHKRMPADQFLDWNSSTNTWSGLMEEWWQTSNELGQPIKWWIIEQNAAQRYLLQYDHVKRWMSARGVRIIGHNTHRNKHDPDLGLTATIPPVWRRGLLRIPYKDALSEGAYRDMKALDFIKMHQDYPHVSADDLVMAAWFFEVNKDQIRPSMGDRRQQRRPAFAKVFSRGERPNFQRR
ncbi:MAG: hypothetical protein ACPHCN_16785 [Mycobacterium sp.]